MDELADGFSDSVFPLAFAGKLSDGRYLVLCLFAGPFHYLSDNGEKRFAPAGFASFLIFVSSDCVGRCVIGAGSFSLGKSVGRGCICWLLSPWLRKLHRLIPDISLKPAVYWAVTVIVLLMYGGGTFYKFLQKYDIREYRMLKAEQAVKERIDDVLMQTEKYLKRQANNQLIFYFCNMALYHTGQLLDHLLDYP